ncbi:MAG: EAL domain-containing protein [Pseudomonadota bacterium]
MNPPLFTGAGAWALAGLAFVIVALGAWVAQEASKRVFTASALETLGWRLVLALGLGTGIWSAHIVMVSAWPATFPMGYNMPRALAAWAMAMGATALAAWAVGLRNMTGWRVASAASILAAGVVITSVMGVSALGLKPGVGWQAGGMAAGLAVALLGLGAGLGFIYRIRLQQWRGWRPQALASVMLALAVVVSQRVLLSAVDWQAQTLSSHETELTAATLTALASVGALVLLVTLWAALLIETHLRVLLRKAKGELQRNAHTDLLTALPNRVAFEADMSLAVIKADAEKTHLALLFIDLDGFKPINEIFGHHGGDRLLCEMAARLRSLAGPRDHLARLGADEFLLLLTHSPSPEMASARANEILSLLGQPCKLESREASLACSIGIAMYPGHGAMSTLIGHADAAMRASKTAGGAAFSFFEPHMMSDTREQLELLQDLRSALAHGEFELFYQPKIHAPSGEITGAEALLRWRHPQRGMISPMVFIPLAERFGLINAIGAWVIEEACRQIRAWRDDGLRMRIAVNLSVHQLRQHDLPDRIAAALKRHQVNPSLMTCEITESVAMEDAHTTMKLFEQLAAVGVHISIDDFGTGYSSLSYLRKLPAGELKIDRSFVLDLETSNDARAVVDAVIKLAQALSLKVVAEGVETEAQHQILRSLGCDELQGYLFAKPMTAQALSLWAMKNEGPKSMDFRHSLFDETAPHVEL